MSAVCAVLDTNVVIAAHRSSGLASPNREILSRWKAADFTLLYSEDVLLEYVEKLIALGVPDEKLREFVRAVGVLGERVAIVFFHLRRYPTDADDIAFLLCAINGHGLRRGRTPVCKTPKRQDGNGATRRAGSC